MKIAKVDVTLDDIAHGEKMSCSRCPIARAVGRAFPDAQEIHTAGNIFVQLPPDEGKAYPRRYQGGTPEEARKFMNAFDGGHPVSPICFDIALYLIPG
jgi:hypothetical protein